MLTRRLGLLASAFVFGAGPALAQQKRPAARKGKDAAAPSGSPADTPVGAIDTAAKWAYIEDYDTGASLLEKQADDEMPPSSMTKLMTLYLVYDQLKQGRLNSEDELPVTERAWRMQGSKMFVQIGTTVKVEDLIRGVVVQSGNDAAIVLAEAIGGSEEQFAEKMNAKAKELGLTNSFFKNCTGWPDPEQHMSPRDIATLAGRIIQDFPDYYHYDAEKSFRYNGIEQGNRNPMVQKGTADGLKTGHTDAGGFGLVASSKRNGRRVILVLNGMTSMHERAEEARASDGLGVLQFRGRHAIQRQRRHRTGSRLARRRAHRVTGGKSRRDRYDAAQLAPEGFGQSCVRFADQRPGCQRRHAGQADRDRRRRSSS